MTPAGWSPPRIRLDRTPDETLLTTDGQDQLGRVLADLLPSRRWFGDKERAIRRVDVQDAAIVRTGADWLVLGVLDVRFGDGSAQYFVPLALTDATDRDATATLAIVDTPNGERLLIDALALPAFHDWCLDQLARGGSIVSASGAFRWARSDHLDRFVRSARASRSRLSGAEQSNSAVVFGDALILKVFRKVQPGTNPDEEVGRFLTERSTFRRVPLMLGGLTYQPAADRAEPRSLALAQSFEPNVGDGWTFTLDRLTAKATIPGRENFGELLAAMRRLGERTGQLHMALAEGGRDPAFVPEPVSGDDAARWRAALLAALERTRQVLTDQSSTLTPDVAGLAAEVLGRAEELERRADGFSALVGTLKTRVHGDYHLGQTLRTPDDDWIILDFEGEPARPIAERRTKTSPLKDVAGMLRSFGYAREAAGRRRGAQSATSPGTASRLADWEGEARRAFVAGYRAETVDAGDRFVPNEPDAFDAALAAWELDKALYEVHYELNNRPDWLAIPLGALLDRASAAE